MSNQNQANLLNNAQNPTIIGSNLSNIRGDQINVQGNQNIYFGQNTSLFEILQPVGDASHKRGGPKSRCYPETRIEVIKTITARLMKRFISHPICWLKGPAGSGKSAISQSVAEALERDGVVVISFFHFRGTGERSQFRGVIPTLAHQLSLSRPESGESIEKAARSGALRQHISIAEQFEELIVKAVPEASVFRSPVVCIIDALDECNDKDAIVAFIDTLMHVFSRNKKPSLRFLVTSRVEDHLSHILDSPRSQSTIFHISLTDFHAEKDISLFLTNQFEDFFLTRREFRNAPRPTPSQISRLVTHAEGSFIFASTLFNFITERNGIYLHDRLTQVPTSDHTLDDLYCQVIGGLFSDALAVVILAFEPLSVSSLSTILATTPPEVIRQLLSVQSIVLIPGDDLTPIQILHTSLRDYLTSKDRSLGLFITPCHHIEIAIRCLSGLEDHSKLQDGLVYDKDSFYAVHYWGEHLEKGLEECADTEISSYNAKLKMALTQFVCRSFEFWANTVYHYPQLKSAFLWGDIESKSTVSGLIQSVQLVIKKVRGHFTCKDIPCTDIFQDVVSEINFTL